MPPVYRWLTTMPAWLVPSIRGGDERLSAAVFPVFFCKSPGCYCSPLVISYNFCICIICTYRFGSYNIGIFGEGIQSSQTPRPKRRGWGSDFARVPRPQ